MSIKSLKNHVFSQDINLFIAKYAEHLEVHITCDGCCDRLSGRRYRCLNCEDMDLCGKCYLGMLFFSLTRILALSLVSAKLEIEYAM